MNAKEFAIECEKRQKLILEDCKELGGDQAAMIQSLVMRVSSQWVMNDCQAETFAKAIARIYKRLDIVDPAFPDWYLSGQPRPESGFEL